MNPEEIWLPDFLTAQRMGSSVLWACLSSLLPWEQSEATFEVSRAGVWIGQPTLSVRLRWDPNESRPDYPGIPERTETELAAYAIAILLIARLLQGVVDSPAELGESFDYWVELENQYFGLEVSGTRQGARSELDSRHAEKVEQLQRNPYGVGGFVVVVGFTKGEIIFSQHEGR